jgi:hypothetical protein
MGLPEWFLHIDSRTIQTLHGGSCVAFKIHFKGPKAHQMEQDFSRLIASGRLDEPTLYIPGYVNSKRKKTLSYRTCPVRDPNDKNSMKTHEMFEGISILFYFREEKVSSDDDERLRRQ